MPKAVCLLILGALCAAAQVEGTVFDASTGSGVAGVKVSLTKGATAFYDTTTDGGGRFRFDNVPPGDYSIRYMSDDYWQTAGVSDYRVFHVVEGSPLNLDTRVMPWSKISGRVVDSQGKGVAKAELDLTGSGVMVHGRTYLRTSWGGGGGGQLSDVPLPMSFRGNTDDRGDFSVKVMPGAYGLSVTPPPDMKPPKAEEGGGALAWTRIYYPGVALEESATKIVVLPGGGNPEVELRLAPARAYAVRGVAIFPDGSPAPKAKIAVGESFRPALVESNADGTFEFPAIPEGEWRFLAQAEKGSLKLRATEWIEVKRHDLENLKLRLAAPLAIRGKVVVEGSKDGPAPRAGPFILSVRGGHSRSNGLPEPGAGVALADSGPKGEFIVQDAYPGVYALGAALQPPEPPYYLESIPIGGADLARQDVEISSDTSIAVVYKSDAGMVSGKAENCVSGAVLLVPRDPSLRGRGFSRSGPCDANDHYEVRVVRPGDYYAVAFAGNGPVLAMDDALLNDAVKVTVRGGESTSADLKTVTKPVY